MRLGGLQKCQTNQKHSPHQKFVLPLNGVYMNVQRRDTLGLVLRVGLNEKYCLVDT